MWPAPRLRVVRSSCFQAGMRALFALSSRRMPTAETTSPSGKRRRISRAMTWLLSSAVQKRCAAVLHGKISFTHSRFAERATLAAQRDSQERFMALFRSNPVACLVQSIDRGVIVDCNQAFCKLSG